MVFLIGNKKELPLIHGQLFLFGEATSHPGSWREREDHQAVPGPCLPW